MEESYNSTHPLQRIDQMVLTSECECSGLDDPGLLSSHLLHLKQTLWSSWGLWISAWSTSPGQCQECQLQSAQRSSDLSPLLRDRKVLLTSLGKKQIPQQPNLSFLLSHKKIKSIHPLASGSFSTLGLTFSNRVSMDRTAGIIISFLGQVCRAQCYFSLVEEVISLESIAFFAAHKICHFCLA